MWHSTKIIKATIKWTSNGKRPRGRPKKWMDKVKEDIEQLGVTYWEENT